MEFSKWELHYKKILADFNFSADSDKRAAEFLSNILAKKRTVPISFFSRMLKGKTVIVVGGHLPTAKDWLRRNPVMPGPVISSESAVGALLSYEIVPEIVVTDLDGEHRKLLQAVQKGSVLIVHAHGDNINAIKRIVPGLNGRIIGTSQCKPVSHLYNFGGFTDGDRAVFIAAHFRAVQIILVGFDFNKPYGERTKSARLVKLKKLKWAKKLINNLKKDGTPITNC